MKNTKNVVAATAKQINRRAAELQREHNMTAKRARLTALAEAREERAIAKAAPTKAAKPAPRKRAAKPATVCPKCGRVNNRKAGVDPTCRVASACKARRRAA